MKNTCILIFTFFSTLSLSAQTTHTDVKIANGNNTIGATICTPEKPTKVCFLIIAGSGPTDRNCNSPGLKTNAFLLLADSLAAHGFASLRYDKRGVGETQIPGGKEENLRFDDMVADAKACISWLKEKGYTQIIVAGHSEGSLVGMLAAKDLAQGYISISGPAAPANEILKEQLGKQLIGTTLETTNAQLDSLAAGMMVHCNNPSLQSIFRPSVQPYLISWMKYNPCQEIQKLKIPVLFIGGKADIQVPYKDAMTLNVCSQNKKPAIIIQQMTHPLKMITDDSEQMKTYSDSTMPLHPILVKQMVAFAQQFEAK